MKGKRGKWGMKVNRKRGERKQNTQGFFHTLRTKFPDVILIFFKHR